METVIEAFRPALKKMLMKRIKFAFTHLHPILVSFSEAHIQEQDMEICF